MSTNYICPMCRKRKHKLCAPSWCACSHKKDPEIQSPGSKSESVHSVSGGLPTLGKGHK